MTDRKLWDEALAEAYASAPSDAIVYHAVELNHETFPYPARVVRWPVIDNELVKFQFMHEADAPIHPSTLCEYVGLPFEVDLPESTEDAPGEFEFRLSNVGTTLDEDLKNAALYGGKITVTFRAYVKGHEKEGPSQVYEGIQLHSPRENNGTLVATGTILNWLLIPYGRIYSPEDYPALVRGE